MTSPCPMRPHHWAAVVIALVALGFAVAAFSLTLTVVLP